MEIVIRVFHKHPSLKEKEVKNLVLKMIDLLNVEADELSVVFVDDLQMAEYNKNFRNKEGTTDVLSFPLNEISLEGTLQLGDIIISVERIVAQAEEYGHSFEDEMKILLIHGLLHLLGYDHEKDDGEMVTIQEDILDKLNYREKN